MTSVLARPQLPCGLDESSYCGKDDFDFSCDFTEDKSSTISALPSERGRGADERQGKNLRNSDITNGSDMSSRLAAVIMMGFSENLVQLAIDVQLLDYGQDFPSVAELFKTVDALNQSEAKREDWRMKLDCAKKANIENENTKLRAADIAVCQNSSPSAPSNVEMHKKVADVEQAVAEKPSELRKKITALVKKNQQLKQRQLCRACKKVELASSGITFLPCGHFVTCESCSEMFDNCPACGKNIMGTVRTFLS